MKVKSSPLLEYSYNYKTYYEELYKKELSIFELVGLSVVDWLKETPDTRNYFRVISRGQIPDDCWNIVQSSCECYL